MNVGRPSRERPKYMCVSFRPYISLLFVFYNLFVISHLCMTQSKQFIVNYLLFGGLVIDFHHCVEQFNSQLFLLKNITAV